MLINYQAWLAAQGLHVEDGLPPNDNVSDSAAQAWNDSITVVSSSSNSSISGYVLVPIARMPDFQHAQSSTVNPVHHAE